MDEIVMDRPYGGVVRSSNLFFFVFLISWNEKILLVSKEAASDVGSRRPDTRRRTPPDGINSAGPRQVHQ